MRTSMRRTLLAGVLVLSLTLCLLAPAGPALAWWPMSGHPVAMPFGGQPPTEMTGAVTVEPGNLTPCGPGSTRGTTYLRHAQPR